MKRINIFFLVVTIVFLAIRCSENEYYPGEQEADPALTSDSVILEEMLIDSLADETMLPEYRKYIYLTIDDAPLNGSEYIDSIIYNEKIKADLFVIGKTIRESNKFRKYYDRFRENPYIEIYNHSYSHANHKYDRFYKDPKLVLEDFEKNQSESDISYKIARLPGRNLWNLGERKKNCTQSGSEAADLLVENEYKVFGWDIEWKYNATDYTPTASVDSLIVEIEKMTAASRTFTSNHVVLLLHNQMFGKINEKNDLQQLIAGLKKNDYTFEHLSAYP